MSANIFYSIPEVWDLCLQKIYDREGYMEGFLNVLMSCGIIKTSSILDAGCGSGFLTLDLLERGYTVTAMDKSSEMVRQIKQNAEGRGIVNDLAVYHMTWAELAAEWNGLPFDFLYCRGNSLVYAASWEQNWFVPERSQEEIRRAIQSFYAVLRPGGWLYLDTMRADEKPHAVNLGEMQTPHGAATITWGIHHDPENHRRVWNVTLHWAEGFSETFTSSSYLLTHVELISLLREVGFRQIKPNLPVRGEENYSVFLARK